MVLETEGFGPQPFHGRVGVSINEHSTSAAEMLTQFAKEDALATIIGMKTPGRLSLRTAIKIGHGYRLVSSLCRLPELEECAARGQGHRARCQGRLVV